MYQILINPMISKDEFESNFKKSNNCWKWVGRQYVTGYGRYWQNQISYLAHRVSYELYKGNLEKNKVIDHLCRNKLCVNPDHLEQVTISENVMRGEGITAKKSRSSSCPNGHPYPNIPKIVNGWRLCKICLRINEKKYQTKNIEQVRKWKRDWIQRKRNIQRFMSNYL